MKLSQLKLISNMIQQNMFLFNLRRMLQAVNMLHSHAFAMEAEKRCLRFALLAEFLNNRSILSSLSLFFLVLGGLFSPFLFALHYVFTAVSLLQFLPGLLCHIVKGVFTTECIKFSKYEVIL